MEESVDTGMDPGRTLVTECRREARAYGWTVVAIRTEDLELAVMYIAGILVGVWLAGRRS